MTNLKVLETWHGANGECVQLIAKCSKKGITFTLVIYNTGLKKVDFSCKYGFNELKKAKADFGRAIKLVRKQTLVRK